MIERLDAEGYVWSYPLAGGRALRDAHISESRYGAPGFSGRVVQMANKKRLVGGTLEDAGEDGVYVG